MERNIVQSARSFAILGAMLLLVMSGCSDDTVRPPGKDGGIYAWRLDHVSGRMRGLWPTTSGTGFVSGEASATFRWDPGGLVSGDGPLAHDLWGTSASNVYAAGARGVFRFDGSAWRQEAVPVQTAMNGVHGTSANDVYVVGFGGAILHYDGRSWTAPASPTSLDLNAVFAVSPGEVYAGGNGGTLIRYDGGQWDPVAFPGTGAILSLGGNASNLYVVELTGTIGVPALRLHRWDGNTWHADPGATTPLFLWDVWSPVVGVAYAVGEDDQRRGAVLRRVAGEWNAMTPSPGAEYALFRVRGLGNSIFVAGEHGQVFGFDGGAWRVINRGEPVTRILDIWGAGPDEVWAAGGPGMLASSGSGWDALPSIGSLGNVTTGWAPTGGFTFAGDEFSFATPSIASFDGTNWGFIPFFFVSIIDMWGTAPDNVVTVGAAETFHWNGVDFTNMTIADTLLSVWGTDSVYVGVGQSGAIDWFDGSTWTGMASGVAVDLCGVWGASRDRITAVGENGTVLVWDGANWGGVSSGTTEDLNAVWGFSGDDIFAVGSRGTILHWDGTQWSPSASGFKGDLFAVFGFAGGVAYAGGEGGVVLELR